MPKAYASADELIADATWMRSSSSAPRTRIENTSIAAARSKKPTFCEKPPALSLEECRAMADAVEQSDRSFRWGSCGGSIPDMQPPKRKSNRAPSAGPWCSNRPRAIRSGRASSTRTQRAAAASWSTWASTISTWRAGSWETSTACSRHGAVLAYPEMASIGDIDNAIATLVFADGGWA